MWGAPPPPGGALEYLALLGDRGVTVITRHQPAAPRQERGKVVGTTMRRFQPGNYFRIRRRLAEQCALLFIIF